MGQLSNILNISTIVYRVII